MRSIKRVIETDAAPFMLDPANPYWDFSLDAGDDADAVIDAGTTPSLDLR